MTHDPALEWLLAKAPQAEKTLWLCDEHFYGEADRLPAGANHRYLTNRYDIARQLTRKGLHCDFNDFDFSAIEDQSQDAVIYRLSKEKPVVHHVIQQAARKLKAGGRLRIAGLKNEGAKSLLEYAAKTLGTAKATRKEGLAYCAELPVQTLTSRADDNYSQLQAHPKLDGYLTKPGQFGWQKVDAGSAFLIATLQAQEETFKAASLLDLGCGYGYLALEMLNRVLPAQPETIVLTDNNAAALRSAQANSQHLPQCQVIAADAGDEVTGLFELIVCNPPFHQGFQLSGDLTDRFLASAQRLLHPHGSACFVVNAFIPLESKAQHLFNRVVTLANNRQYKVVRLSNPSPR